MCRPISSEAGRRHLCSADHGQLVVPCYRLTIAGRRAFSCSGPSALNNLPAFLRDGSLTLDCFKHCLNCFAACYVLTQPKEHTRDFVMIAHYINVHLINNNNIIIIIIIGCCEVFVCIYVLLKFSVKLF